MKTANILLAGFGGQGILFAGKFVAYSGLYEGQRNQLACPPTDLKCAAVPPTAPSSSAILRSGSPIVNNPDILLAMNMPSLDKFENAVNPGGKIFVDSTLVERKVNRTDVDVYYVPATKMAADAGMPTLANMILVGKIIKETGIVSFDNMDGVLKKVVSAKKQDLLDLNKKALDLGYNF